MSLVKTKLQIKKNGTVELDCTATNLSPTDKNICQWFDIMKKIDKINGRSTVINLNLMDADLTQYKRYMESLMNRITNVLTKNPKVKANLTVSDDYQTLFEYTVRPMLQNIGGVSVQFQKTAA